MIDSNPALEHLVGGGALVTANRRLSRFYHHAYRQLMLSQGESVWQTPMILPYDAWLLRLHADLLAYGDIDCRVLDRQQSELIWREALESTAPERFLSKGKTAASLARSWQTLNAYQADSLEQSASSPEFQYGGADTKLFLQASQFYQKRLHRQQWVDASLLPSTLSAEILRLLEDEPVASLQARIPSLECPLLLTGFLQLTPQQTRFLQVVENSQAVSLLPVWQSGVVPVQSLDDTAHGPPAGSGDAGGQEVFKSSFSDASSEYRAVALWCRQLLEQQAGDKDRDTELPCKIGVVFHDLAERRTEILRCFDAVFFPALSPHQILEQKRPYDIGLGNPLTEWPLVRVALALFDLKTDQLDAARFSHLLLSPYIAGAEREQQFRLRFDRDTRSAGLHEVRLKTLLQEEKLPLGFSDVLKRLDGISTSKTSLAIWCGRFSEMLQAARWPGKSLDSHEFQCFEAWQDALASLARLGTVAGELGAMEAVALLHHTLEQRLFQPETDELPIQLLSPADSVGLSFTHLWICGNDSSRLPGAAKPDAWLPRPWQKSVAVPMSSAQQMGEEGARLLAAWLSASPCVMFSYAREQDGQEMQAAAMLQPYTDLQALPGAAAEANADVAASVHGEELPEWLPVLDTGNDTHDASSVLSRLLALQSQADPLGPALADGQAVRGGAAFFEDQAQCPFRAFVNHRLRARALEEAAPGLDARLRGTALHHAMQVFWERVGSRKNLAALEKEELANVISDCVEAAFVENDVADESQLQDPASATLKSLQLALEKERLCQIINYWLLEKELPRGDFEVLETERGITIELETLQFSLAVDRIDRLETGEEVVVDYKTGSNNKPAAWMKERLQSPQLPLYAVSRSQDAEASQIDGLAFAEVNRAKPGFKGIASRKDLIPGLRAPSPKEVEVDAAEPAAEDAWGAARELWVERINTLAAEIKSGHATVDPQVNACLYCDLAGMCRIDPQHAEDVLDEELDAETSVEGGRS